MLIRTLQLALVAVVVGSPALAQQGAGQSVGVARAGGAEITEISGTVVDAKVSRCPMTTGRGLVGAHILVERDGAPTVDLHLGPIATVEPLLEQAPDGTEMTASAFRTAAMPENAYATIAVTIDGDTTVLRDDTLRPIWAQEAGRGPGAGAARGPGFGGRGGGCWWAQPAAE